MKEAAKKIFKLLKIIISVIIPIVAAKWIIDTYGIIYEVNDDAILSSIAAGGYGKDTIHMVYVNFLFSLMLRPLYAMSYANWFVIAQMVLVVISIAVIIYLFMNRMGVVGGALTGIAMMYGFAIHIFYSVQYTESSFIIGAAGILLIADSLGELNLKTATGILLTLMGSMIRWTSFYATGGMAAAILLCRFFMLNMEGKKKAVLTMILLFAVTFGARTADIMFYKADPAWNEFMQYNEARTRFSDYKVYELPDENPFADKGITDMDYKMLRKWDFYDEGRFTTEMLKELSVLTERMSYTEVKEATKLKMEELMEGKTYNYMFFMAVVITFLGIQPKKETLMIVGTYALFAVLLGYLLYNYRIAPWVETGMMWTICTYAFYAMGETDVSKMFTAFYGVILVCSMIGFTEAEYLRLHEEAAEYYRQTLDEQQYIERMSRDKEHLYLLSTHTTTVSSGFDVWHPHGNDFYSNIVLYGGWLSRAPHRDRAMEKYGVYRPIADAVDNPLVYIGYHNISNAEKYAEQELGCNIEVIWNGENAYAPCQLVTE